MRIPDTMTDSNPTLSVLVFTSGLPPVPTLLADQMLARTARWLRLLGYDCELVPVGGPTGEDLASLSKREGRLLLTCSLFLIERYPDITLGLPVNVPFLDQVRKVVSRLPLDFRKLAFSRCDVCNTLVHPVDFDSEAHRLPDLVRERRPRLTQCPVCRRLYWEGSHVEHLMKVFSRELGLKEFERPDSTS